MCACGKETPQLCLVRPFHLSVCRTGTGDGWFLLEPRASDSKPFTKASALRAQTLCSPSSKPNCKIHNDTINLLVLDRGAWPQTWILTCRRSWRHNRATVRNRLPTRLPKLAKIPGMFKEGWNASTGCLHQGHL